MAERTRNSTDKSDEIKRITERLEAGIKDVFESGKYQDYLNTMSKFHNYSFRNAMLIYMQKPDATLVAGFNSWRDNFGRSVNKGETGIRILAYAPYKTTKDAEKLDKETGLPILDKNGVPVMEQVEVTIPYFKPVSVFDVSQTNGKELPQIATDLNGEIDDYDKFMDVLKEVSPVPIKLAEITTGSHGFYSRETNDITVKEGMSQAQTIKTTIHEIAHAMLHNGDDKKDKNTREVEAESVAYTVCQHFGIDSSDYSFGYVAGWSKGKELPELQASLETIRETASTLITAINEKYLGLEKTRDSAEKGEKPMQTEQKSESQIIGNTPYKYIKDKQYVKVPVADAAMVEEFLKSEGIKYSGRKLESSTTFTVSKENLDALNGFLHDSKLARETISQLSEKREFAIYQIKSSNEYHGIRFESFEANKDKSLTMNDYDLVYKGDWNEIQGGTIEDKLDTVYDKFNNNIPEDFKGHSLSVSDVIVVGNTAHYVDDMGFAEMPDFFKEKQIILDESAKNVRVGFENKLDFYTSENPELAAAVNALQGYALGTVLYHDVEIREAFRNSTRADFDAKVNRAISDAITEFFHGDLTSELANKEKFVALYSEIRENPEFADALYAEFSDMLYSEHRKIDKERQAAHEAGLPYDEYPYDPEENFDPYAYDPNRMSDDDYDRMHDLIDAERGEDNFSVSQEFIFDNERSRAVTKDFALSTGATVSDISPKSLKNGLYGMKVETWESRADEIKDFAAAHYAVETHEWGVHQVVTFNYVSGTDEKYDYRSLSEAVEAANEYVKGTKQETYGEFVKYDGATVLNKENLKIEHTVGEIDVRSIFSEEVLKANGIEIPAEDVSRATREVPTITCEWSESPAFENGKTYSVREFDEIMRKADAEHVAGERAALEKYGTHENWYNAKDEEFSRFFGYDKVKFTVNMPDGTTYTERQNIGDGFGGVIEFLSEYGYGSIISLLKEAIAAEITGAEISENVSQEDFSHSATRQNPENTVDSISQNPEMPKVKITISENGIIGNAPYKSIANKHYIKMSADEAINAAEKLEASGLIKYSGRIIGDKATLTIDSEDEPLFRALTLTPEEIISQTQSELTKSIIELNKLKEALDDAEFALRDASRKYCFCMNSDNNISENQKQAALEEMKQAVRDMDAIQEQYDNMFENCSEVSERFHCLLQAEFKSALDENLPQIVSSMLSTKEWEELSAQINSTERDQILADKTREIFSGENEFSIGDGNTSLGRFAQDYVGKDSPIPNMTAEMHESGEGVVFSFRNISVAITSTDLSKILANLANERAAVLAQTRESQDERSNRKQSLSERIGEVKKKSVPRSTDAEPRKVKGAELS